MYQRIMEENDELFECEARNQEEAIYLARKVTKFGSTEDEVQRRYNKWAQHYDKVRRHSIWVHHCEATWTQ